MKCIVMKKGKKKLLLFSVISGFFIIGLVYGSGYVLRFQDRETTSLVNEAIETWDSEDGESLVRWTLFIGDSGSKGNVQLEKVNVKDGQYSVKFEHTSNSRDASLIFYKDFPDLEPKRFQSYVFGCWVKASEPESANVVASYGGRYYASSMHSGSGKWEYLTTESIALRKADSVRIHLVLKNAATAYFDSIHFSTSYHKITLAIDILLILLLVVTTSLILLAIIPMISFRPYNVEKFQFSIVPAKLFFVIGSIFGVLMVFITPPFQSPDEDSHFYRAYGISNFQIVNNIRERDGISYVLKEQSFNELFNSGVSQNLLAKIERLKDVEYNFKENFLLAVEKLLGPAATDQYESLLLSKAKRANVSFDRLPHKSRYTADFLPKSLQATVHQGDTGLIAFHPEKKITLDKIRNLFSIPLEPDDQQFIVINHSGYPPIPYIPQSLGIFLGRIFHLPPIMLMYLGRIFNLIIWLMVMSFAIRLTPIFKWVFCLLALTPMSLFLASTLSGDVLTNALAFLLIALFFHLAFSRCILFKVNNTQLIFLFSLVAMLSLAKQAYILLIFLYFLIPPRKIGGRSKYFLIVFFLMLTGLILNYIWSGVLMQGYSVVLKTADPRTQLQFIFANPFSYFVIFLRTLLEKYTFYKQSFIGSLGWLDTNLPDVLINSYILLVLVISLIENSESVMIRWVQKVGIVVLIIAPVIGMLFTYVYLIWNPVGAAIIEGVQGRHLIPLSPLICLLFYNRTFKLPLHRFALLIAIFLGTVHFITLIVLLKRYYLF